MNNTDEQKRNIKNNTMYNFIPIFEKKSSEMEHFLRKVISKIGSKIRKIKRSVVVDEIEMLGKQL